MTNEKEILINEFREKFKQLTTICDRLRDENRMLLSKNKSLEKVIEDKEKELSTINTKYDNLKTMSSLISGENAHDTKIKLNRIVREIDKCLSLIDNN
ncbi:MAG: hypothetical protein MJ211_04210 [Bacteroidales bacterium]|nr:hypothetical protein [Bacteroidales bacterium]